VTEQRDLMGCDDDLDLPTLLERAGDNAPVEHAWPQTLADLVDVLSAAAADEGIDSDRVPALARKMVAAIAHYLGGQPIYLARGELLKRALQCTAIWQEWDGRRETKQRLAKKYDMSVRAIEKIIVAQSRLHRERFQGSLFERTGS